MASLMLDEVIVAAVTAKLKAGLAARITTINTEKNDGITLAAPRTTGGPSRDGSDYYRSGIESIPQAPAVIVVPGPMQISDNSEGAHSFITETRVAVYVLDADPNRETLGIRLQRLIRAVLETLWDDAPQEALTSVLAAYPTAGFRIFPLSTAPGRVFEPDSDDTWRGFYLITFRVEQLEG